MGDVPVNVPSSGTAPMRARSRVIGATTYYEQYMIPQAEKVWSNTVFANTFRIPARAVASQPVLAIFGGATLTKIAQIRAIILDVESIVAKTVINPVAHLYRITASPTGGTNLPYVQTDPNDGTDGNLFLFQDASADGTNSATALAFTPNPTAQMSGRFVPRMSTLAGLSLSSSSPANLVADYLDDKPLIVRTGNGYGLRVDAAAALTAGDFHYEITVIGEIFTLP